MYITGKFFLGSLGDGKECYEVRKKVFCDEMNLSDSFSKDDDDNLCIQVAAYETGEDFINAVSSGRLEFVDGFFKINRVATLPEFRRKGYADFVVRMLIDKAVSMGADEIFADVVKSAVPFFKIIGFSECGEPFMDSVFGEIIPLSVKPCNCKRACHC